MRHAALCHALRDSRVVVAVVASRHETEVLFSCSLLLLPPFSISKFPSISLLYLFQYNTLNILVCEISGIILNQFRSTKLAY